MAFRQVDRATERFDFAWPDGFAAEPVFETDAGEAGAFLLRIGHPLRPECEPGTLAGATFYVTRLFDYHRGDLNYPLALEASTIVRGTGDGTVVGVCFVGGGGRSGQEFGVYDVRVAPGLQGHGIGTRMPQRALSVLADQGVERLHLWRNDDCPARRLYERLGFTPTGAVE
jgi:GNAT superfamily N-acetyltransferase